MHHYPADSGTISPTAFLLYISLVQEIVDQMPNKKTRITVLTPCTNTTVTAGKEIVVYVVIYFQSTILIEKF